MQQTIRFGQVAQPSVLQQMAATVKSLREKLQAWWTAKSETFSDLCATEEGETFTHGEVVLANLGAAAFILLLGIVGAIEKGGAL